MWAGFFCRQDVSISIFGRTKEFSEVRGTSLMCNFGVRSRFLDVIYGVRPPNGSPVIMAKSELNFLTISNQLYEIDFPFCTQGLMHTDIHSSQEPQDYGMTYPPTWSTVQPWKHSELEFINTSTKASTSPIIHHHRHHSRIISSTI